MNILEQFEELYSRLSLLNNVDKGMRLAQSSQQLNAMYNYLCQINLQRGYLLPDEVKYANQLQQMLIQLQVEKAQVDQELANEMMKHLAKMKIKQYNNR